jgi:asparagine synthase (glutamine-hydrolysing)
LGALAAFLGPPNDLRFDVAERMIAAAPHRGSETYRVEHGRCVLACAREGQFGDAGVTVLGRLAAAFAGTVDNLDELAAELERTDIALPARTPETIIAAGFDAWGGERLAERMRGSFAVAVTDGDRLFCFRDALGLSPLFYRRDANGVFVATEAKQVVAGAGIARQPDIDVLAQSLFETYDRQTPSALRGVERLPKGMVLAADWTDADVRLTQYWEPESVLETADYSPEALRERFTDLMNQAVRRCLAGNDAILLSGGVDSPAVAAFAAPRHLEQFGTPLVAITAVYPRFSAVDERGYTELAAGRLRIPLHTWEPETSPLDDLEDWVALTDGPVVAGSLALYADAYGVARELGHRSVLTGEFAEFVCTLNNFLVDHLLSHGRFRAAARQLSLERSRGASPVALMRAVAASISPRALRALRVRASANGIPAWIDRNKANEAAVQSLAGPGKRWSKLQLSPFVGAGSSVDAEEICQAVSGVRMRRPFADLDLWRFFLSLRAEVKFPDLRGKTLLRRLLRGRVPDEILDRRDKTFFDDAMLATVDYAKLRRLLAKPEHRFDGVDYNALGEILRREEMGIVDYVWVMRLAAVHAFLSRDAATPRSSTLHV